MEKNRAVVDVADGRKFLFILTLSTLIGACSSRPCREPRAPDLDQTKVTLVKNKGTSGATTGENAAKVATTGEREGSDAGVRIRVYKPDGSRQCERRAGIAVDLMERELAGIMVHSRENRKDGLKHIQVCGSPSGMINVFEIDAGFAKQAEERGFKRLED